MDWQPLVEEGIVYPAPLSRPHSMPTIRRAWECVVKARMATLSSEWELADQEIRHAFCVATDALAFYHDHTTGGSCGFETARRIGTEYFGERLAEPIFYRASVLREMLPLEPELDPAQAREVRRCVAASSEYVALVECFTYSV